jgi:hypothetical protein
MFIKALARYLDVLFIILFVNSTPGLEIIGNMNSYILVYKSWETLELL